MLIWRGRGLVVLLAILGFIVVEVMVDGAIGDGYYASHMWPKVFAAVLTAIPIWFAGKSFENSGGGDHFWFVPVKWWAPIIVVFGIFAAVGSTEAAPEPSPKASDPVAAVKSEPAPEPVAAPLPTRPILPKPRYEASAVTQPQLPTIAQVYVDSRTRTYYPEGCAHPDNAFRMAKSVARSEGYQLAAGCSP